MGGYSTGTGTSIYSSKLVERPRKFPRKFPRKYTSKLTITRMEVFSRGRFASIWNTREILMK